VQLEEQTVRDALASIAAKQPTPGGGAVASLVAALGAALGEMVVNYSAGKKSLLEHEALHQDALAQLEHLRTLALSLAEEDERAYGRLNELWKLDADDPRRVAEFPAAVEAAIDVPNRALDACLGMLDLLERLPGRTNRMLASDLAIAAVLAEAGARSAAWNVRINLPLLRDRARAERHGTETDDRLERAREQRDSIEAACRGD
jgi:formiminotetrahydrofolate cyclodeaminase